MLVCGEKFTAGTMELVYGAKVYCIMVQQINMHIWQLQFFKHITKDIKMMLSQVFFLVMYKKITILTKEFVSVFFLYGQP